jgi:hypothetical protein
MRIIKLDNTQHLYCPGCRQLHPIANANIISLEPPTLKNAIKLNDNNRVCEFFVIDGKIKYLSNCTHSFRSMLIGMFDIIIS